VAEPSHDPDGGPVSTAPARGFTWRRALLLASILLVAYEANGRALSSTDTRPTNLLTVALFRGDGPFLDRFARSIVRPSSVPGAVSLEPWAGLSAEPPRHLVSLYPVAPAVLALPFAIPQIVLLDHAVPGWESLDPVVYTEAIGKHCAAALMAILGAVVYRMLATIGFGPVAWRAALAVGLGSSLWTIGSQALWQHGPAALMLALALALLAETPSRARMAFAGLATGALVCCRSIDLVFAAAILAFVAAKRPRWLGWFLPFPIALGALLLRYNTGHFGSILGGEKALESMHPAIYRLAGNWATNPLPGLFGTLVSPARGLLVHAPWVALATLGARGARRPREGALFAFVLLALVPFLAALADYVVWWGGTCYGCRYWTETFVLWSVPLARALDRAETMAAAGRQGWRRAFGAAFVFSVALQAIGAFCYPSLWATQPTFVNVDPGRLWDVRDSEVSRCLREGPKTLRAPWRVH
jgi:hypothetical protein